MIFYFRLIDTLNYGVNLFLYSTTEFGSTGQIGQRLSVTWNLPCSSSFTPANSNWPTCSSPFPSLHCTVLPSRCLNLGSVLSASDIYWFMKISELTLTALHSRFSRSKKATTLSDAGLPLFGCWSLGTIPKLVVPVTVRSSPPTFLKAKLTMPLLSSRLRSDAAVDRRFMLFV